MRRLNEQDGAVAVIVGLLLVALLGIGALVVDVGNLYWERRQLQTGAEAAALSAAQDFASGNAGAAEAGARVYADANDARGAFVSDFAPNLAAQEVSVTTRTGDIGGGGVLSSWLAQLIGNPDYFATATATARWGGVGGGPTIPLTISECEWDLMTGGLGAGALPTPIQTVFHHTGPAANSCAGPSGQDYPGGFGWLDTDTSSSCTAQVVMGEVGGDTGSGSPSPAASTGCTNSFFATLLGQTVLMPIHTTIQGVGSNATYTVSGFAALEITGYRFGGGSAQTGGSPVPCGNPNRCIAGRFVAYYALDAVPAAGAPNFGAVTVQLTG
jgi:hypothetical protein